jgi:ADP-ribosylation factor-like protein 8
VSKKELHGLLDEKGIENRPLLVLSNKIDIEPHMSEVEIIRELNLDYVYSNPWAVLPVSALKGTNLEAVVEWLSKKGK